MGKRRAGRELALKVLFQVDVAGTSSEEALESSSKAVESGPDTVAFSKKLVDLTVANMVEIDEILSRYAKQWPLNRMANVDRCLLRMATSEILYCPDIPNSVSVDEAVELAKKYSTAESGRFINGVLGSLLRDLPGTSGESGKTTTAKR